MFWNSNQRFHRCSKPRKYQFNLQKCSEVEKVILKTFPLKTNFKVCCNYHGIFFGYFAHSQRFEISEYCGDFCHLWNWNENHFSDGVRNLGCHSCFVLPSFCYKRYPMDIVGESLKFEFRYSFLNSWNVWMRKAFLTNIIISCKR